MFAWATAIYGLCLATSALCAWLLARSYMRHGSRLLMWSAACFACFAVNNLVLVLDLVVFPDIDLSGIRTIPSLAGVSALLVGFIWEAD